MLMETGDGGITLTPLGLAEIAVCLEAVQE